MDRSLPLLLLLTSCALPAAEPASSPKQGRDGALDVVTMRVREGGFAFAPVGDGWVGRSGLRGVQGTFDAAGARLSVGGEVLPVATVGVGREASQELPELGAPALGACLPERVDAEGNCVRRLERAAPGLVEWWSAGPDGLQQGWELSERPEGAGAVVVEVALPGAAVDGDGDALLLTRGDAVVQVDGLAAWDADGRDLPVRFEAVPEGYRVLVDDRGARYPVSIDPVYATPVWTVTGTANESLGLTLANAGDVNGDGYGDMLVGAPTCRSFPGCVYVFHGSATGLGTTAALTLTGEGGSDNFGMSVAGAGDVNGDGYDDALVGAFGYDSDTGRVYLYTGSSRGLPRTATTTLTGTAKADFFGKSVAGAGDVNGDSFADILIGAPGGGLTAGSAYVYHGSALGIPTLPNTRLDGEKKADAYGFTVSPAGDVNGDGFADVIVGAQDARSSSGRVYVHHGSAAGVDVAWTTALTGEAPNNYFGASISDAGDVDNDGYDDIVVGAPGYRTGTGSAYVYLGSAAGVGTTVSTSFGGEDSHDAFGYAVSDAGDVSGDGFADIVIGAYGHNSDTGRAYVFEGTAFGTSRTASSTLDGEAGGHMFGAAVAGPGDVDGDGYAEVLISAYAYDASGGKLYLYQGYGDDMDLDGDGYPASDDCDDDDAAVNPGATEVCDPKNTDENCNEVADDNDDTTAVESMSTWQLDDDMDGYTDPEAVVVSCDPGDGYFAASSTPDCDDDDPGVRPGAQEVCDGRDTDENCDGLADDNDPSVDSAGFDTWAADADEDGFTDPEQVQSSCDAPAGYTEPSDLDDCDDGDATSYPGATDVPDDGIDQDCDGTDATDGGAGDDTGDTGEAPKDDEGGCGCATSRPDAAGWIGLGLGLVALSRRRR